MADVPAWPGPVVCRYSAWDHRVHAFPDLGELNSVAVCTHIARTDKLAEPPEGARWCEACRMIRAAQLEVRREMADEWLHTPGRSGRGHLVGFWEKDEVEAIKEDNPDREAGYSVRAGRVRRGDRVAGHHPRR